MTNIPVARYDADGWPLDVWGQRIPRPLGPADGISGLKFPPPARWDEATHSMQPATPPAAPAPPKTRQARWREYVAGLDPESPAGRRYGPMADVPPWFE
jgi:hypothetical protein